MRRWRGRDRMAAALLAMLAGCTATVVPPDGLDDARVRSMELERRVAELEARNAELGAQLSAARDAEAVPPGPGAPDAEVRQATPRLVSLASAGGSVDWAGPATGGTRSATVHVAIEPRDGRSRAIQVAGRCEVTVAFIDPSGSARALGHRAYGPLELRDAWRAGLMGSHYAIEVPVSVPDGLPRGPWTVSVAVTDGWTGRTARWTGAVPPPPADR